MIHPARIIQAKRYGATQGSGRPEAETIDVLLRPYKACHLTVAGFFIA